MLHRPLLRSRSLSLSILPAFMLGLTARSNAGQEVPRRETAIEIRTRFLADLDALQKPATVTADTLRLEVGSPEVNALFFPPHRARNSVYIGDATSPTTTWTNELTVADSAGMRVHRWVTKGTQADGATWELQQTYNGRTLAPLKWARRSSAGADSRLVIDGTRVRGVLKGPGDAPATEVDRTIPRAGFIASASDLVPMAVGLRAGVVMTAPVWSPQSTTVETRVFSVLREETVRVEGADVKAWRVEERVHATGELKATWWLTNASPYMVLAEIPLANGQIQRITGVALD